jgi:hypothetical protein
MAPREQNTRSRVAPQATPIIQKPNEQRALTTDWESPWTAHRAIGFENCTLSPAR